MKWILLKPRRDVGFDRFDAIAMALYAAILAFAIHHYQPFVDEAQAWLIARDSSLHQMLFRRLHYEGAPALWPVIVWVAIRLHLPYAGLNWLGGCFALVGIYILLGFAPFPRIFRWLLPFTFFLQYEYAVVARPYALYPALLFALCILFTLRRPRPVLFALVAGLLANISLHAAAVAGIFSLLYVYDLYCLRRRSPHRVAGRTIILAAALFVLLALCSAAVAFPAPDAVVAFTPGKTVLQPHALLRKLIAQETLPPSAPPLDALFPAGGITVDTGALPKVNPILFRAVLTVVFSANAACYPIARSNLLAVAFLASVCLWLRSRGCLRLILPFFVPILFTASFFVLPHHTGIFGLTLLAVAWIALKTPIKAPGRTAHRPWVAPAFGILAAAVVLLQIGWSYHCIHQEAVTLSDPGRETEAFLVQNFPGGRIADYGFESTSTQAYASHNLFFNQPHAYWVWSVNTYTDRRRSEVLAQHPAAVVVADLANSNDSVFNQWYPFVPAGRRNYILMLQYWQQNGYRITHRFCGVRPIRLGIEDSVCEVILESVPGSTAAPASTSFSAK